MNLAVLKKTRRAPKVGDIFVMQPPDGQFLYGRVISVTAAIGPIMNCILIYVYRQRSAEKDVVPVLLRGQLLVPSMMTNRLAWARGYFEPVEHRPLTHMDQLPQHCFHDPDRGYFDEYSNQLPGPVEPVGTWGLHSFRTIDDEISKALGIPLAPDD
jgi:hypothetical protein